MKTRKLQVTVETLLGILLIAVLGIAALHSVPAQADEFFYREMGEAEGVINGRDDTGNMQGDSQYSPVDITTDDFTNAYFILKPSVQPELFLECIDNPYSPFIPGTIYHLEEQTDEGVETITVIVTNETREIMGIQATVVRDTVEVDGEVTEDTRDWFAQDDRGNVWYLGEATQEYEDGEVVSTEGSWEAGVDGAVPGIIMLGEPRPGDMYFQEFWEDEAEDMGAVMSLSEKVKVDYGSFDNTLQTADYNPLDDQLEHKWYVPGVGVVKEIVVDGEGSAELISISHDSSLIDLDSSCGTFVGTVYVRGQEGNLERLAQISPEEAESATLSAVGDAQIIETLLESRYDFLVYIVRFANGQEVSVDAGDGVVLAVH